LNDTGSYSPQLFPSPFLQHFICRRSERIDPAKESETKALLVHHENKNDMSSGQNNHLNFHPHNYHVYAKGLKILNLHTSYFTRLSVEN
jgi:hypothetical protein